MVLPSLKYRSKALTCSPGCMMSISAVAVPVFLDTTPEPALLFQQWARTYHYGHQALPTLSVATCGLYAYLAMKRRAAQQPWLAYAAAAIVTVVMVPFTWIVMVPTNNLLFRLTAESQTQPLISSMEAARELVVKWTLMHATRSLTPLAGAIIGATATA